MKGCDNPGILVLAAHPDDEVLGCGGTMALLSSRGHRVHVAILGEGITSRYDQRSDAKAAAIEDLRASSLEAASLLGAELAHCGCLPDNRFDTVPLLDIVKQVERIIKETRPQVIFTHHGGDLNIDHAIVNRATLTATRPLTTEISTVYAYEVASSTEWSYQSFYPVFRANSFFDVTEHIDTKLKAMSSYESETRSFPHPRSADALMATSRNWGKTIGVQAAEAFELIRKLES